MDSEDFFLFSRNEPLHLLLDVLSVNDEEGESLSSKLRTQREKNSLVQYQSNSFGSSEWFLMKGQQVLFFVVLLLPLSEHTFTKIRISQETIMDPCESSLDASLFQIMGLERRSNVYSMTLRLATVSFKRCPHVQ